MLKRTAAIVAGAVILTVPMVLPAGAQSPGPNSNTQMPMSAKGNTNNTMQGMSPTDMLKQQIKASQRAQAVANAIAKKRPSAIKAKSHMNPGGTPDYFGASPNYANSPLPKITWKTAVTPSTAIAGHGIGDPVVLPVYDPTTDTMTDPRFDPADPRYNVTPFDSPYLLNSTNTAVVLDPINQVPQLDPAKVNISGGIRKFIEPLPGLGAADPQTTVQNCSATVSASGTTQSSSCDSAYTPVAIPDTTTYPGTDYYVIGLKDYYQQFSPDLPPTRLRGYYQINAPGGEAKPYYLGPIIQARANVPVRVKFINNLPAGSGGDLFLPVDTTTMGAGLGPKGAAAGVYQQNRATIHLHGGLSPWISDGTPHQWTTPVSDAGTAYPKGVSVQNVPDMPNPGPGALTFYYTNQQSARLLWYHDHTYGMTRLNVYAGEVSAYTLSDPVEQEMILGTAAWLALPANAGQASNFATPVAAGTIPADTIPLIIQDKAFVPDNQPSGYFPQGQLAFEDPTWQISKWGGTGSLWFPHVYMPNQNPYDDSGANASGRWDYGPWFWPIFGTSAGLVNGEKPNPYANSSSPWEPPMIPGVPSVSMTPESYVDTPVVNGVAYPYLNVAPKAYHFRILNGSNDRMWNLQLYCAKSNAPMWNLDSSGKPTTLNDANAGEVPMVPAVATKGFPSDWPTDGRAGGVPDPAARATNFLQYGTESGFLPNLDVTRNGPIGYNYNRRDIVVLNIAEHGLMLAPAERADVVVDFSQLPANCQNVILYNDSPAPVPAFDPRNDYYTNDGDQQSSGGAPSTLPGYGPDTRTIMQFRVSGSASPAFNVDNLANVLPQAFAKDQPAPVVPEKVFAAAYPTGPNAILGQTNNYSRIASNSLTFPSTIAPLAVSVNTGGSGYVDTPNITIGGPGTGAVAVPTFSAGGVLTNLAVGSAGSGYTTAPTVTIDPPTANGVTVGTAATARATVLRGRVTGFTVSTGGTGYYVPVITIPAPTTAQGTQASASAVVTNGVVTGVTMINGGSGYTAAPAVTVSAPHGAGVTATLTAALGSVTAPLGPKTIQELFEMQYGRMNATLGVEMPFTNSNNATTLPMGYAEPATEILSPSEVGTQIGSTTNGTQIWKITHNGVDTHAIHFHLFDVQLINRVGWDGAIRPPDANEVGWKDTLRMNPLEDAIVALRPIVPKLPFKIPDSIRPIDPTMPVEAANTATPSIRTFNPITGQAVTVPNALTNYGWEYVWHCHILGHEENDMMRPMIFNVSPAVPTIGTATSPTTTDGTGQAVVTWTSNANFVLSNFVVQRATDAAFTSNVVQTSSGKVVAPLYPAIGSMIASSARSYTDADVANGTYYYRVRSESTEGYSVWSAAKSVTVNVSAPSTPTAFAGRSVSRTTTNLSWAEAASPVTTTFRIQRSISNTFAAGTVVTLPPLGGTVTSTLVTGLVSGTTYYYRIMAVNTGGSSNWSTVIGVRAL